MSELHEIRSADDKLRLVFLAGVSTLALLSATGFSQGAEWGRDDRPTVWIELGGQLERVNGASGPFSPAFMTNNSDAAVFSPVSPLEAQRSPRYGLGEEAKISFQPHGSGWIFSAAMRYGRSNASKDFEYQTEGLKFKKRGFSLTQPVVIYTTPIHSFSEVQSRQQESDLVLDFQAGRDVGVGFWGMSDNIRAGVRFAQFTTKADVNAHARPDLGLYLTHPFGNPQKYGAKPYFHDYVLAAHSERSFSGLGPSLSWTGSVPLVDGARDAHLDLDLGLNGAVLFGRQKADVAHKTTAKFEKTFVYNTLYQRNVAHSRSHSVAVPNLGASAGISYRIDNFKMSAGYRADFFFGAMDTGIDAANRSTTSFHGPFATISLGLGG